MKTSFCQEILKFPSWVEEMLFWSIFIEMERFFYKSQKILLNKELEIDSETICYTLQSLYAHIMLSV